MKKVGDTVYLFDENRRVYKKDENGKAYGAPIFEKHFVPYKIAREEKRSFFLVGMYEDGRVGSLGFEFKVGKGVINRYLSEEEKSQKILRQTIPSLYERIRLTSNEKLKRIIDILDEKD